MNQNAVLVIDVQNDFCPGGALAVPEGNMVVPIINDIIAVATKRGMPIFASRDWHPEETMHFNTKGGKWPPHCIQTTKGAEFHPELKLPTNRILISKGTEADEDAYSAFEGKDGYKMTLRGLLDAQSVKKIFICGLTLDYCVKATALDAKKYGFEVLIFENATRAVNINPDDGIKAKFELWNKGIEIKSFPDFS